MSPPLRVLVVDDSALMRKLIPQLLESDEEIKVVGTAMDGSFGLRKIEELRPDVVTLDLEMPRMDGMEMLKQITRRFNLPVVVVSAHSTSGATTTFKALNLGAFDFVTKPQNAASGNIAEIAAQLIAKIKAAAKSKATALRLEQLSDVRLKKPLHKQRGPASHVIAIGVSTGGPNALQYMLSQLPADLPACLLIVQHMPEGFTDAFARRLDGCCSIDVKEAQSGDLISAGRALICPGNRHMRVRKMPLGEVVTLTDDDRVTGHRPSANVLFRSVSAEIGARAIGVVMTGMGEDGAEGICTIRASGGFTVAQDELSSVVWGMPKAAIERGGIQRIVPLDQMAETLVELCSAPVVRENAARSGE